MSPRWGVDTPTEGSGDVYGYITLPLDLGTQSERACEGLELRVTRLHETEVLGLSSATWLNERCTYQVTRLPDDGKTLAIHVTRNPDWRCNDGTAPVLTPELGTAALRKNQPKVQDFRFTCSATSPSVAEASPSGSTSDAKVAAPASMRPRRAASTPLAPRSVKEKALEEALFHFGVRAGYAFPFGVFTGEADSLYLYNLYLGTMPLWLDLELSLNSNLRVGAFLQLAPGHMRGRCDSPCDDRSTGLQVSYHFAPRQRMDPWVGLGIGYEWTNLRVSNFSMSYQGPALQLQAGGDYGIANPMRMGPFVNLTVGQYSHLDVTVEDRGGSESIQRRAPHFWLSVGVRLQAG